MIISNQSDLPAQVLNLPVDFVVPEKRLKRSPQPIDFEVFSEEQKRAVLELIDYIDGLKPEHRMMVLMGYAGTGKSYTIGKLMDFLLYARKLRVASSAPTNKAVQVCKAMCDIEDAKLTFSTIHKLLGLKESYDYNGRIRFTPDPMNPPSLEAFDVLFIDEASMFDDELFRLINPMVEKGLKVIFIGDPAQIPPVNRIDCIPFLRNKQLFYKIGVCELKEIRRQAKENPLLNYATEIREQRGRNEFDFQYAPYLKDDMGLIPISRNAKDIIYKICETYFCNPMFREYPDFMKVIAWRNVTVNAINKKVRSLIYGQEVLPRLMPYEKMIADEPIATFEKAIITTNAEFQVMDFNIKSTTRICKLNEDVLVKQDFKYYETKVQYMSERGMRTHTIMVLHEDDDAVYQSCLDLIEKVAIKQYDKFERKKAWRAYYDLYKAFAKVKYNYAITSHKAQGSSYENCMMIEWDMYENTRYEERNRIRYVAATRARKYLFIVK